MHKVQYLLSAGDMIFRNTTQISSGSTSSLLLASSEHVFNCLTGNVFRSSTRISQVQSENGKRIRSSSGQWRFPYILKAAQWQLQEIVLTISVQFCIALLHWIRNHWLSNFAHVKLLMANCPQESCTVLTVHFLAGWYDRSINPDFLFISLLCIC